MRRPAFVTLVVGTALLVASPLLLVTLGAGLLVCPNPGVCSTRTDWVSLVPGIVAAVLGVVALVAAALMTRGHPHKVESSQ